MILLESLSVQDVVKKSILESAVYEQAISASTIITIIIDMLVAVLVGMIIYNVYKKYFQGVVYSKTFAITLVGMTILACTITLAISTNIVISLGMVGALSIVRFRTAVKEPLDLLYLFWAITMGITVGASMYILVIVAMVIMIVLLKKMSEKTSRFSTYMMIVHYGADETGDGIMQILGNMNYKVKSQVMRNMDVELTVQVVCRDGNFSFAERIRNLEDVRDVTLVQFDGEYHG